MGQPIQEPRFRRRGRGGFFYVFWYDEAEQRSKRESLGTQDPQEARARFSQWLAIAEATGDKDLTVSDALAHYLEHNHWRVPASRTRAEYSHGNLRRHLGALLLTDLKKTHGKTYAELRRRDAKPASDGTIARELTDLMAALNYCVEDELVERVPTLQKPPPPPPKDRWLTTTEIDQLLAAAAETRRDDRLTRTERFIWIGLETGARKDSIQRLTWTRVDLNHGFIDFREPGKTRTAKRQAVVPISNRLRPVLERAQRERTQDLWVLDRPGAIKRGFELAVDRAGLVGVSPHTLRHTCATHMARAGVSMFDIAQILGDSVATVERNYAHHDPHRLRDVVNFERQ